MQDRFKFRAINMKTKEVIHINDFYWFESEGICEIDENNTASGSFAEYYINKCTGLKDKNGKLIYEGDIVNQIYEDETTYKCEVVYKNCSFQLKHIEDKNKNYINTPMYCYAINYLGHYTEKRLEVIGNIYENKDLLNE